MRQARWWNIQIQVNQTPQMQHLVVYSMCMCVDEKLTCQNPGAYVMVSSGYLIRTSAVKGFPAAGPRLLPDLRGSPSPGAPGQDTKKHVFSAK